ncbi:MAG: type II secretion system protein [Candidatus Falkowbacteria bacterium]
MPKNKAFSLIELLTVVLIIGIIVSLLFVVFNRITTSARDTKRKADLFTIGRFFTQNCYTPDAGAGTYDLSDLLADVKAKNPQYKDALSAPIFDPKSGTRDKSNYYYAINSDNKCCLYANLENSGENITLPAFSIPTPGGGSGVFASTTNGINGSPKYYQISN